MRESKARLTSSWAAPPQASAPPRTHEVTLLARLQAHVVMLQVTHDTCSREREKHTPLRRVHGVVEHKNKKPSKTRKERLKIQVWIQLEFILHGWWNTALFINKRKKKKKLFQSCQWLDFFVCLKLMNRARHNACRAKRGLVLLQLCGEVCLCKHLLDRINHQRHRCKTRHESVQVNWE